MSPGALRTIVAIWLVAGCSAPNVAAPSGSSLPVASGTGAAGDASATNATRVGGCPTGPGSTTLTVASGALGHDIRVTIITTVQPDDVAGMVYLLHGANTDETQWAAIGTQAALGDVASKESTPIAVVLPDLPNSYDMAVDSAALVHDVVPAAETCLGGMRTRSRRAVGGISRGGQLALTVAAAHPDLFSAVGGHSPVVDPGQQAKLARDLVASGLPVWLDVGADDGLRPATVALAQALTDLGATPELHVSPGRHDRPYWAADLRDYLTWYDQQLAA